MEIVKNYIPSNCCKTSEYLPRSQDNNYNNYNDGCNYDQNNNNTNNEHNNMLRLILGNDVTVAHDNVWDFDLKQELQNGLIKR